MRSQVLQRNRDDRVEGGERERERERESHLRNWLVQLWRPASPGFAGWTV
jgi:hypothetical protein